MKKTITMTLAVLLALSGSLTAAEAAHHHGKRKLHRSTRPMAAHSMNTPMSPGVERGRNTPCRTIPGMSSNNWFGVDNDFNVYRDKPQC